MQTDEPVLVVTKSLYNEDNELVIMSQRKVLTDRFSYQSFIHTDTTRTGGDSVQG